MTSPKQNITLKDVAREVGVSAMTVSRALSGKSELVNAETARRCRDAAEQLGYVPNLMARALRGQQLRTVVMLAEHISSHFYLADLVDTVSRAIERRGFGVISCQSARGFQDALRNFKLAGAVILAPPEALYRDLREGDVLVRGRSSTPAVVIHSALEQDLLNEVSPDISALAYIAAHHLLDLRHEHLAFIGGPRRDAEPRWFDLRRAGIVRALEERGLNAANLHHQPCPETDLAPAALQQLLARAPRTTGLICINDEVAIASIVGAQKLGHDVPGRLSVVGCNDIQLARFFRPALTTVAIDMRSMVETALDLLLDDMRLPGGAEGHGHELVKIRIPANLIVRDSTAVRRSASLSGDRSTIPSRDRKAAAAETKQHDGQPLPNG